jgi:CRP-like cAMP-binding protein
MLLPLPQRLARRLLLLAEIYGEDAQGGGRRIKLHLPQEALGQMLGTSRQSVSRLLKTYEAQGLIAIEYGHVTICDGERLRRAGGTA